MNPYSTAADLHPCVAAADAVVAALAARPADDQTLHDGQRIVRGLYLSWDRDRGAIEASLRAVPDALVGLGVTVSGQPRWLSLCLELGSGRFAAGDVLGVVLASRVAEPLSIETVLRSSPANPGSAGTVFDDRLEPDPARPVAVAMHRLRDGDPATAGPAVHTLVLRLPRQDLALDLLDLRLFVTPAAPLSAVSGGRDRPV